MQVTGKVVVVTGGANGIGRALCEALHRAGAAKVVVADLDLAGAEAVAASIDGGFDPLSENAGGSSDEPWARSWAVHVMAHVYAARHLIPRMKARGEGYFLN